MVASAKWPKLILVNGMWLSGKIFTLPPSPKVDTIIISTLKMLEIALSVISSPFVPSSVISVRYCCQGTPAKRDTISYVVIPEIINNLCSQCSGRSIDFQAS